MQVKKALSFTIGSALTACQLFYEAPTAAPDGGPRTVDCPPFNVCLKIVERQITVDPTTGDPALINADFDPNAVRVEAAINGGATTKLTYDRSNDYYAFNRGDDDSEYRIRMTFDPILQIGLASDQFLIRELHSDQPTPIFAAEYEGRKNREPAVATKPQFIRISGFDSDSDVYFATTGLWTNNPTWPFNTSTNVSPTFVF